MLDTEKTSTVGGTAVIDYLTCGSCLREFPLQKITAFIQHKKLDCDDENSESLVDPELQCNYCPRGFMTAWGLLVHAQLTHNLKIFLEKASRTFLEQSKMSYDPSQSQLYGSQFQILPSGYLQSDRNSTVSISGSLHSDRNVIVPISGSQQPDRKVVMPISVSLQPPACVRSTLPGMSNASQRSNMDLGKNICISTDCFTGNRNILAGLTGMEMSQTGKKVNNRVSLTDVNESEQLKNDKSVQIHQKIIAVPCQQIKTSFVDQISPPNVTDSGVEGIGPFRTRSNTLPNMSQIISNADSSRNIVSGQKTVDSESPAGDSMEFPQVISTDDPGKIHNFSCSSRASVNELIDGVIEVERGSLEELEAEKGTEGVSDTKFHKQGEALGSKATEIKQSTNISSDLVLDKNFVENQIDNLVTEKEAKDERSDDKEENRDDLDDVDRIEPCCDNLGCGITVIPGSHQTLQKCCNAVVPKKRKRHFETKHMPFSWSSSRYAKRRMLQSSRDRHFTSVSTTKSGYNMKTGSTIYIDVEPGTFVPDLEKPNSVESTQVKQSQSSIPKMASSERILTSQSKPRSLILRPGAVFSIPLTYTIPASNSTSVFMPAAVSQQLVASSSLVHSKSDNSETVSDPLESVVETTETVQQPSSQGSPVDNAVSDNSEVKPVLDGELRRRKYPTSKPFKCEVCEVAFNQRIHLKKHMSKHTGVKPYKCGQCDYSTVERSHLKVHIRIHTGEKPFKCTYCEYATAQNSTLKIHLKRHHGGRMFQCPNCSKEFTQQTQLNDHEWEHAPTDNSSKQTKLAVHKGVMKTGVVPDQSDQLEAAETITLETPVQQEEMTLDTAALSQTTSAISSTTGVGHVIPAGDRGIVVGNVTSGANSSADLGQVVPAASRIAVAGSETSGVNGSADLGQVVPAASRISVTGSETSGTNGSANLGHVVSAASRNIVIGSVTCEDTGSRDLSHVVSVPEPSLTDNEAAVLLNSLTAKLLEESEKTSQSHLESLESVNK